MTKLILYNEGHIDLGFQYLFNITYQQAVKEKAKLARLVRQLDDIAAEYFEANADVADAIVDTKREIRQITAGSPVTEAQEPPSSTVSLLDDAVPQQLDDAQMQLLKQAYRKLATITHPDKAGGSVEAFQAAKAAYEAQDLNELIHLYVTHFKFRNLYWRQSFVGMDFVFTEVNRPRTQLAMMQRSALMKAASYHMGGHKEAANTLIRRILLDKLAALNNELTHLRNKYHGNSI